MSASQSDDDSGWVPVSPGVWEKSTGDVTWTLSALVDKSAARYTLTGPHPAPTWSTGDRTDQGSEHVMSMADKRIADHRERYGI